MNAVIACGGTGGHLFPGLAVAEVLQARGHEVLLFISEKEVDTLAVEGRTEFRFEKLPTVALPSPFSPAILAFVRRFNESLSLCRAIFRKFQPQVVLGMGGFTSTAPILAGRMRGVPTFIHESNAIPGKANRHTARFVRAVLLGFKECADCFPKAHTEFTGTPIRSSLAANRSQRSARKAWPPTGVHDPARDGRQPGRERDQPGVDQGDAVAARHAAPGDSSFRQPRRAIAGGQLPARKHSRPRGRVSSSDGGGLQRG